MGDLEPVGQGGLGEVCVGLAGKWPDVPTYPLPGPEAEGLEAMLHVGPLAKPREVPQAIASMSAGESPAMRRQVAISLRS